MNPESSDPQDPETNTWWIWLPIFFALFVIFATLMFERDFLFESQVVKAAATRLA